MPLETGSLLGRRGGRGYDNGRGHGGRGNNQNIRSDRTPSAHTFRPDKCPDQDAVDRVKTSIVHRHVTGNRIFVDDNTYRNLMDATERYAVYYIRVDLKANKDPLGKSGRKRTSEVAALQHTVQELSAHVGHYPGNRTENGNDRGQDQYPEKLTAAPTRISLDWFASPSLTRNRKAMAIDTT